MPKDLEHIDVNALVPDTPPEELPERESVRKQRGSASCRSWTKRWLLPFRPRQS